MPRLKAACLASILLIVGTACSSSRLHHCGPPPVGGYGSYLQKVSRDDRRDPTKGSVSAYLSESPSYPASPRPDEDAGNHLARTLDKLGLFDDGLISRIWVVTTYDAPEGSPPVSVAGVRILTERSGTVQMRALRELLIRDAVRNDLTVSQRSLLDRAAERLAGEDEPVTDIGRVSVRKHFAVESPATKVPDPRFLEAALSDGRKVTLRRIQLCM